MNKPVLGAISMAALAAVACAKKESAAPDPAAAVEEAVAGDPTLDAAAEAADVYAAPVSFDLASIRSKEALGATADAAFAAADSDADGSLSLTEFYALAALMAPEVAADSAVDGATEVMTDVFAEGAEAEIQVVDEVIAEEPSADSSALDASYAAIAGADGRLTADDLRAAFLAKFDAADANLDGALDDGESAVFAAASLF